MQQLLKNAVDSVINNRKRNGALASYLKKNGWDISINKEKTIKDLKNILNGKLEKDPHQQLVDLLLFQKRSAIQLSEKQKDSLRKILSLIENSENKKCQHKELVIGYFLHGGGFCPIYPQPELICLDCGLNITLYNSKNKGIQISDKDMDALEKFGFQLMKDRKKMHFAEVITRDPIKAYNETQKWEGPLPLKIVDVKKLEENSGK
jgi:hypothetical protein